MGLDDLETLCLKVIDAHQEAELGRCNLTHIIFDYVCQTDLGLLAIFQGDEDEIDENGFLVEGCPTHLLREEFKNQVWDPLYKRLAEKDSYPSRYTQENYLARDIDGDFDGSHYFEVLFE